MYDGGWQYNLTHIAAGDLLRAEVAAGTECGKKAEEYMQQGKLVPNDIVVTVCGQIFILGRRVRSFYMV